MLLSPAAPATRAHFPAALADEAREWLAELSWPDLEPDEALELPGHMALRGVARHYTGGLAGFVADGASS